MIDTMKQLRDLTMEAADALWALKHGKEPNRDPITINQEIYALRQRLDELPFFVPSPLSKEEIARIFAGTKAIITSSHVVYKSGKHGSAYVNKDAIYPHTMQISLLCQEIARRFASDGVEVVVAPAVGGVILSQWVAYHLTIISGSQVLGIYADKAEDGQSFVIKRGYDKVATGKNVLVVEDVLTTGDSAKKVIEVIRTLRGRVIGLGVLCNRGQVTEADVASIPRLTALLNVELDTYDEEACPLCQRGIPINTDVGKGREFLARQ